MSRSHVAISAWKNYVLTKKKSIYKTAVQTQSDLQLSSLQVVKLDDFTSEPYIAQVKNNPNV